jgi:catalase
VRPETFADHYTQARLFFASQTEPEQNHIVSALVFELSKCVDAARPRGDAVAPDPHRRDLAARSRRASASRAEIVPAPAPIPAKDMEPSPDAQHPGQGRATLEGRKVGAWSATACDDKLIASLKAAVDGGRRQAADHRPDHLPA